MTDIDTDNLDRLIWTDIETTGLSAEDSVILEIGFVITDLDLRVVDDFQVILWDDRTYDAALRRTIPVVKKMHSEPPDNFKLSLINTCREYGEVPDRAFARCVDWLRGHGIGGPHDTPTREDANEPLCGSSVQFDRLMFDFHWPAITNRFSYRNIDVSTVKELCRRYNPDIFSHVDDLGQRKAHRVLSDIADTIAEFKFYRDNFIIDARPVD